MRVTLHLGQHSLHPGHCCGYCCGTEEGCPACVIWPCCANLHPTNYQWGLLDVPRSFVPTGVRSRGSLGSSLKRIHSCSSRQICVAYIRTALKGIDLKLSERLMGVLSFTHLGDLNLILQLWHSSALLSHFPMLPRLLCPPALSEKQFTDSSTPL